jgi:hypothetical protein
MVDSLERKIVVISGELSCLEKILPDANLSAEQRGLFSLSARHTLTTATDAHYNNDAACLVD